jgi:hypothetical protein
VRLTKRGGDYLKASILSAIISSVLDVRVTLALSLAMMFAAVISEILLRTSTRAHIEIKLDHPRISVFKGEEGVETITVLSRRKRFIDVALESVEAPEGINTFVISGTPKSMVFSFRPAYAGRYEGINLNFSLSDPLQLFRKKLTLRVNDFVIDSLPKALLVEPKMVRPSSLSLGERTGRTAGYGHEFYAIDDYHPSSEKKSIFWKKVARMPDAKLVVKVRESNIPKAMTIGLITYADRALEERLIFVDAICEALAQLGSTFLTIGCAIEVLHTKGGSIRWSLATSISELSDVIMEVANFDKSSEMDAFSIMSESHICALGLKELENQQIALASLSKPSIVINEPGANPLIVSELAILFRGEEDLSRIVHEVIEV